MSLSRALLDLVAPPLCLLCDRSIAGRAAPLCRDCSRRLPWWRLCDGCPRCGHWMPLGPEAEPGLFSDGADGCPDCLAQGSPLHACHTLLRYEAPVRQWIPDLKSPRSALGPATAPMGAIGWLARELAGQRLAGLVQPNDWITAVPLHPRRRRQRGFNQSDWIAARIARALGARARSGLLVRSRATRAQASLQGPERRTNVRHAFRLTRGVERAIVGRRVWLVDDVLTTGHTLEAAADPLLAAGVREVRGVTLAATLPARRRIGRGAPRGTEGTGLELRMTRSRDESPRRGGTSRL